MQPTPDPAQESTPDNQLPLALWGALTEPLPLPGLEGGVQFDESLAALEWALEAPRREDAGDFDEAFCGIGVKHAANWRQASLPHTGLEESGPVQLEMWRRHHRKRRGRHWSDRDVAYRTEFLGRCLTASTVATLSGVKTPDWVDAMVPARARALFSLVWSAFVRGTLGVAMTQAQLAAHLGRTRRTVYAYCKLLEELGLLRVEGLYRKSKTQAEGSQADVNLLRIGPIAETWAGLSAYAFGPIPRGGVMRVAGDGVAPKVRITKRRAKAWSRVLLEAARRWKFLAAGDRHGNSAVRIKPSPRSFGAVLLTVLRGQSRPAPSSSAEVDVAHVDAVIVGTYAEPFDGPALEASSSSSAEAEAAPARAEVVKPGPKLERTPAREEPAELDDVDQVHDAQIRMLEELAAGGSTFAAAALAISEKSANHTHPNPKGRVRGSIGGLEDPRGPCGAGMTRPRALATLADDDVVERSADTRGAALSAEGGAGQRSRPPAPSEQHTTPGGGQEGDCRSRARLERSTAELETLAPTLPAELAAMLSGTEAELEAKHDASRAAAEAEIAALRDRPRSAEELAEEAAWREQADAFWAEKTEQRRREAEAKRKRRARRRRSVVRESVDDGERCGVPIRVDGAHVAGSDLEATPPAVNSGGGQVDFGFGGGGHHAGAQGVSAVLGGVLASLGYCGLDSTGDRPAGDAEDAVDPPAAPVAVGLGPEGGEGSDGAS